MIGPEDHESLLTGNPSLEKCRALKEQREEAAEVASLDVTNIINCSGKRHFLITPGVDGA